MSHPRSLVSHHWSVWSAFTVMMKTRSRIQDRPPSGCILRLSRILCPSTLFFAHARHSFIVPTSLLSSSRPLSMSSSYLGFRRKIGLHIHWIPGFLCRFQPYHRLLSFSPQSASPLLPLLTFPTLVPSIQSTLLKNSELGTNS